MNTLSASSNDEASLAMFIGSSISANYVGEVADDWLKSLMENFERIQGLLCVPIQGPNLVVRLRLALVGLAKAGFFAIDDFCKSRDHRA